MFSVGDFVSWEACGGMSRRQRPRSKTRTVHCVPGCQGDEKSSLMRPGSALGADRRAVGAPQRSRPAQMSPWEACRVERGVLDPIGTRQRAVIFHEEVVLV